MTLQIARPETAENEVPVIGSPPSTVWSFDRFSVTVFRLGGGRWGSNLETIQVHGVSNFTFAEDLAVSVNQGKKMMADFVRKMELKSSFLGRILSNHKSKEAKRSVSRQCQSEFWGVQNGVTSVGGGT